MSARCRLSAAVWTVLVFIVSSVPSQETLNDAVSGLVLKLEKNLSSGDISSYLDSFAPGLREKEEAYIQSLLALTEARRVRLIKAGREDRPEETGLYVQALYENPYSVFFETWYLELSESEKGWFIRDKKITGSVTQFFKIRIPSGRSESVDDVMIEGEDIRLHFQDAVVFYDNLPGQETALLVLGEGELLFSPSDDIEKHQLKILYKNSVLKDSLEWAYLRFNDSFFREKVRLRRRTAADVTQEDKELASRIFEIFYPRSFTTRHPHSGELLSSLPNSGEAVFDFKGGNIGEMTYLYSPSAEDAVTLYSWDDERIVSLYTPDRKPGEKRLFLSLERPCDIVDCDVSLSVDPERAFLSGTARVELKPEGGPLDVFKLKFSSDLNILRILDPKNRSLFFTQDKARNILYVYPFNPVSQGEKSVLQFFYRGKFTPPAHLPDVLSLPQARPETLTFIPQEYTSLLYSGSTYWYPSPVKDDYFTARLKIIVPSDFFCIANGALEEKTDLDRQGRPVPEDGKAEKTAYVYQTRLPVKYLSFIIGDFKEMESLDQPVPMKLFDSNRLIFSEKGVLEDTREVISRYQEWFGPFPYQGMKVVRRIWPVGGGHSPASFVVINEVVHVTERERFLYASNPVDLSRWKEYFIAHEIAHQWWGHSVTWKTYRDQWLSEGAAQFAAFLFLSQKHGEGARSSILKKFNKWTDRYSDWGPVILGSRLSFYHFEAYQSIIYDKAALILNMLKDLTGEKIFFRGLKTFLRTYRYKAARTGDFIRIFSEVSGKDLGFFFSAWLWSYTLPETRLETTIVEEKGFQLQVSVRQLKDVFIYPLWVEWTDDGGRKREMLIVDREKKNFTIKTDGRPGKIKFNPDNAVPGKFIEK